MSGNDYALATVHIGGSHGDGSPWVSIRSAVCHVCGGWARHVVVSGKSSKTPVGDDIFNVKVSRVETVVIFACPEHYDAAMDLAVDQFDWASNRYEPDDLVAEVDRVARQRDLLNASSEESTMEGEM